MTTYYVTQGWVDEDGPHEVGDTIEFPDFGEDDPAEQGMEGHKFLWLSQSGWIGTEKPELPVSTIEPEKKAHRARGATKK
jgi:hypothetical protein